MDAASAARVQALGDAPGSLRHVDSCELEAASGLEPESRGFADLRLNHLATPPLPWKRTVDQPLSGYESGPANAEAVAPSAHVPRRRMIEEVKRAINPNARVAAVS